VPYILKLNALNLIVFAILVREFHLDLNFEKAEKCAGKKGAVVTRGPYYYTVYHLPVFKLIIIPLLFSCAEYAISKVSFRFSKIAP
jgi:hypothetical protein